MKKGFYTLLLFVLCAGFGCRTTEDSLTKENIGKKPENPKPAPDDPATSRPWINYYGIMGQDELFNLSDEELKSALYTVLDSIHCKDPSGEEPDEFLPGPVQDDGAYLYLKWFDEAKLKCQKDHPGTEAQFHRALGYGTRDQVNPRDHPELRNARFYMYQEPAMGHVMEDQNGKFIIDVYGEERYGPEAGVGDKTGKNPDGNKLNCEHTWPKSRFAMKNKGGAGYSERESDLHHLYPTSNPLNGWRSSYYFAEVIGGQTRGGPNNDKVALGPPNLQPSPEITLAPQRDEQWSQAFFQPPPAHRGNVARSLFYFSVRYQLPIEPVEEFYLRKWHREDPIDAKERLRNDTVMNLQRTRNPFIDFPELVDQISDF